MLTKTMSALSYAASVPHVMADPQIKQLLAQHLIVLAVAEAEDSLEEIILEHFRSTTTVVAQNLARSCLSNLFRSVKTSEIAGFLGRLGDPCKASFQDLMGKDAVSETRFNNLVISRHSVVHEAQCNVTFEELQASMESVQYICESVRVALRSG